MNKVIIILILVMFLITSCTKIIAQKPQSTEQCKQICEDKKDSCLENSLINQKLCINSCAGDYECDLECQNKYKSNINDCQVKSNKCLRDCK